jgi:hypothetical protein
LGRRRAILALQHGDNRGVLLPSRGPVDSG